MTEYQQDDDGVISCRYRLPPDDDPNTVGWCMLRKECCNYDPDCRVPIPTNLSLVVNAAEELVEASGGLVRLMERKGYGSLDLAATRTALSTIEAILKQQRVDNGED